MELKSRLQGNRLPREPDNWLKHGRQYSTHLHIVKVQPLASEGKHKPKMITLGFEDMIKTPENDDYKREKGSEGGSKLRSYTKLVDSKKANGPKSLATMLHLRSIYFTLKFLTLAANIYTRSRNPCLQAPEFSESFLCRFSLL
jgi:hypothetical protein